MKLSERQTKPPIRVSDIPLCAAVSNETPSPCGGRVSVGEQETRRSG